MNPHYMVKWSFDKRDPNYTERSCKTHKLKILDNAMANCENRLNDEQVYLELYMKLNTEQHKPYNKQGLKSDYQVAVPGTYYASIVLVMQLHNLW